MMGCSKCGYKENPDILHFHHIDPTTKIANISRMVGKNHSMERIKNEIAKCKLLCITCHHMSMESNETSRRIRKRHLLERP